MKEFSPQSSSKDLSPDCFIPPTDKTMTRFLQTGTQVAQEMHGNSFLVPGEGKKKLGKVVLTADQSLFPEERERVVTLYVRDPEPVNFQSAEDRFICESVAVVKKGDGSMESSFGYRIALPIRGFVPELVVKPLTEDEKRVDAGVLSEADLLKSVSLLEQVNTKDKIGKHGESLREAEERKIFSKKLKKRTRELFAIGEKQKCTNKFDNTTIQSREGYGVLYEDTEGKETYIYAEVNKLGMYESITIERYTGPEGYKYYYWERTGDKLVFSEMRPQDKVSKIVPTTEKAKEELFIALSQLDVCHVKEIPFDEMG